MTLFEATELARQKIEEACEPELKETRTIYICHTCDEECNIYTEISFETEEFWGAPVSREVCEDKSECCGSDVWEEEVEVEDA